MAKILIVEDEANALNALVDFFESLGFEVHAAVNGTDAIANGISFEPDVLICDWILEGDCDGIAVARALYQRNTSLSIIFVTARSTTELAKQCGDVSTLSILRKPVSLFTLKSLVDDIVESST
jgi:CheY-like chemotaxis protein